MSKQRRAPGELELVRAFVNSRQIGHAIERLSDPPALAAWLEQHDLAPSGVRATRRDLARAHELRESLREALVAHTAGNAMPPAACRALEDAATRARLRLRFDGGDGRGGGDGGRGGDGKGGGDGARLVPEAGGVAGALGRLVAIIHDAIAQGTWTRLKACREPECEWAFYDHTKNRAGAWCSMERCGNRAKARAYRERTSSGTA